MNKTHFISKQKLQVMLENTFFNCGRLLALDFGSHFGGLLCGMLFYCSWVTRTSDVFLRLYIPLLWSALLLVRYLTDRGFGGWDGDKRVFAFWGGIFAELAFGRGVYWPPRWISPPVTMLMAWFALWIWLDWVLCLWAWCWCSRREVINRI